MTIRMEQEKRITVTISAIQLALIIILRLILGWAMGAVPFIITNLFR